MGDNVAMVQIEKAVMDFGAMDSQMHGARAQILVIEDDPHMQKVLQRIFRDQGYGVTVCGDRQGRTGRLPFGQTRPP